MFIELVNHGIVKAMYDNQDEDEDDNDDEDDDDDDDGLCVVPHNTNRTNKNKIKKNQIRSVCLNIK